jgi:hypothetical protein
MSLCCFVFCLSWFPISARIPDFSNNILLISLICLCSALIYANTSSIVIIFYILDISHLIARVMYSGVSGGHFKETETKRIYQKEHHFSARYVVFLVEVVDMLGLHLMSLCVSKCCRYRGGNVIVILCQFVSFIHTFVVCSCFFTCHFLTSFNFC